MVRECGEEKQVSEQKRPVQPIRVSYACDKCGGDVLPTGLCLTSIPAQYPHDCQQCGERYTFTSLYPRIEYIDATAIANDLARKTLGLPTDCDAIRPPTFQERHDANNEALAWIKEMVHGKSE